MFHITTIMALQMKCCFRPFRQKDTLTRIDLFRFQAGIFKKKYFKIFTVNASSMHCIAISKRKIDYASRHQRSIMIKMPGYLYVSCNKFAMTMVKFVNCGHYILSQSPWFSPATKSDGNIVLVSVLPYVRLSERWFPGIISKSFSWIYFKPSMCTYWMVFRNLIFRFQDIEWKTFYSNHFRHCWCPYCVHVQNLSISAPWPNC